MTNTPPDAIRHDSSHLDRDMVGKGSLQPHASKGQVSPYARPLPSTWWTIDALEAASFRAPSARIFQVPPLSHNVHKTMMVSLARLDNPKLHAQ